MSVEVEPFNIKEIEEALGEEAMPHTDPGWGDGWRIDFTRMAGGLEIYPSERLCRYHNPTVFIEMADFKVVRNSGLKLISETEESRVVLQLFAGPGLAAEGSMILVEPRGSNPPAEPESRPVEFASKPAKEKPENPNRVQITGRVGRDPDVKTTPKGKQVMKFPLAVHSEDGSTSWTDVLLFDEKIEPASRFVRKGALLSVVGYRKSEVGKDRYGKETVRRWINGVAVSEAKAK